MVKHLSIQSILSGETVQQMNIIMISGKLQHPVILDNAQ